MRNVLFLSLLLTSYFSFSQSSRFNNYFGPWADNNPALTGLSDSPRIFANYRNDYPALSSNTQTTLLAGDLNLNQWNSGVGLTYSGMYLSNGVYRNQECNFNYAYHLEIGEKSNLSIGMNGGFLVSYIDTAQLNISGIVEPRVFNAQLDLGVVYSQKLWLVGASIMNLEGEFGNDYPSTLRLHGAYQYFFNDDWGIGTEGEWMASDGFYQANVSLQASFKNFVLGTSLRSRSNFGILTGVSFDRIKFYYSYLHSTSSLTNSYGNSHELGLRWQFNSSNKLDSNTFNWKFF